MWLRNKKTGEIIDNVRLYTGSGREIHSISEITDEWEDVPEESKKSEYYWYIGYKNDIRRTKYHHISDFADNQVTATRKEIGNCFESLEEAEKALEKLKAWKRLKDKGIKIVGWDYSDNVDLNGCKFNDDDFIVGLSDGDIDEEDLDLLFSQEDD